MSDVIDRVTVRLGELATPFSSRMAAESEKNDQRVTPSFLVRQAVADYLDGQPGKAAALLELSQAFADFRADFARVGGNLNQLTRFFNIHHELEPSSLSAELREVRRQHLALIEILKRLSHELNNQTTT